MEQEQKRTSDTLEKSAKMMQAAKQNTPQTLVQGSSQPSTRVNVSDKQSSQGTSKLCPGCNRPVKSDWKVCPHCGENLN